MKQMTTKLVVLAAFAIAATSCNKAAERTAELDKKKRYITYCNTGERSSAAAFVLNKLGFEAAALQGGLNAMVRHVDQSKAR